MTNEEKKKALDKNIDETMTNSDNMKKLKESRKGHSINYKAERARDRKNSKTISKLKKGR
jgi:hypothetical protein